MPGAELSQALPNPKSTILNHQSSIPPLHQHAVSGNDDPRNGLALTPDAHWMFDKGLWTAVMKGDDFLILVAIGKYTEASPLGEFLDRHNGRPLHFHNGAKLRPAMEHLEWHRTHHKFKTG